jgi:hypothetical protein
MFDFYSFTENQAFRDTRKQFSELHMLTLFAFPCLNLENCMIDFNFSHSERCRDSFQEVCKNLDPGNRSWIWIRHSGVTARSLLRRPSRQNLLAPRESIAELTDKNQFSGRGEEKSSEPNIMNFRRRETLPQADSVQTLLQCLASSSNCHLQITSRGVRLNPLNPTKPISKRSLSLRIISAWEATDRWPNLRICFSLRFACFELRRSDEMIRNLSGEDQWHVHSVAQAFTF